MARINTHAKDCREILGKPYLWVHQLMDEAYRYNPREHRALGHSPGEIFAFGVITGNVDASVAGILHLLRDGELLGAHQRAVGNEKPYFDEIVQLVGNIDLNDKDGKKAIMRILEDLRAIVRDYVRKEREWARDELRRKGINITNATLRVSPHDSADKVRDEILKITFPLRDFCAICGKQYAYEVGAYHRISSALRDLGVPSISIDPRVLREGYITASEKSWCQSSEVVVFGLCKDCLQKMINLQLGVLFGILALRYPKFRKNHRIGVRFIEKRCLKCGGMMKPEFYKVDGESDEWMGWIRRVCGNCGMVEERRVLDDLNARFVLELHQYYRITKRDPNARMEITMPYQYYGILVDGPPILSLIRKCMHTNDWKTRISKYFSDQDIRIIGNLINNFLLRSVSAEEFLINYYPYDNRLPQSMKYYWT
ncbi:MAG: hypothetical protein ACTSXX_08955 [Candidatus Baldrarchaeia archaeon]